MNEYGNSSENVLGREYWLARGEELEERLNRVSSWELATTGFPSYADDSEHHPDTVTRTRLAKRPVGSRAVRVAVRMRRNNAQD